jgi:1-deoxy-D-xylulose-5-phosphate synthase
MPDSTGLLDFGARFPGRLIDVGIAEQHAVTSAAGMAMGGLVPVVAVYATFLTRAIDQVIYDVGLHDLPVIFCLDRAGITGDDGASHHGVLDLALLSRVPGITIFAPASLDELPVMLRDAVAIATGPDPGPVAIRWSKTVPMATVGTPGVGTNARCVRRGDDVCLVGIGKGLEAAIGAADELERFGIGATVWDPRCVRPLDPTLVEDAATHPLVVSIEDGVREGGIGATLAERVLTCGEGRRRQPQVLTMGTPTAFLPHAKPDELFASLGLDAAGVAATVLGALKNHTFQTLGATA